MSSQIRIIIGVFAVLLSTGCGGGGSSCPGDAPLECSTGGCCPRGYPYNCGNGLCYQFGCPVGSPQVGICELKLSSSDPSKIESEIPIIQEEQAGQSVLQSDPE
jgi:hypothetical protein